MVFGAVLGVLVSLCSVGAGALGLAVLFSLYPRLPPSRIVGSDLAHAVPDPCGRPRSLGTSVQSIGRLWPVLLIGSSPGNGLHRESLRAPAAGYGAEAGTLASVLILVAGKLAVQ